MSVSLVKDWNLPSLGDIAKFQKKILFDLPEDYKSFLLEQNGGKTSEKRYLFQCRDASGRVATESVRIFYGLNPTEYWADLDKKYDTFLVEQLRMPHFMLPIGCDEGGNQICLLLNNQMFGNVVFWDRDSEVDFSDPEQAAAPMSNCSLIATSFTEFLSKLSKPD